MSNVIIHHIKKTWLFFTLAILAFACVSMKSDGSEPVFEDDFERYRTDSQAASAYQIWDDGARLKVSLDREHANSGNQALQIEIIGPNEKSESTIGSIYFYLPGGKRNWKTGTAVLFWIENPSNETLLLSFNFKEKYNEYWAVNSSGIFLLKSASGEYRKIDIDYGNLPIPAWYRGYVIIPFFSFSVPDWNTALGDTIMDLRRVDTFSLSFSAIQENQTHFFLDDIQIIDNNHYRYLEIFRKNNISFIPDEGQFRLRFNAYLVDPVMQEFIEVQPNWQVMPEVSVVQIDKDGSLTISNGSDGRDIVVMCDYIDGENKYTDEFLFSLVSSKSPVSEDIEAYPHANSDNEDAKRTGSQPSSQFETWAYQNRPIFVFTSIIIVLLLVIVLSAFQKRI